MGGVWKCGNCKRPYSEDAYKSLKGNCPVCKVGTKDEFVWQKDKMDCRLRCSVCGIRRWTLQNQNRRPCSTVEQVEDCAFAQLRKREQWTKTRNDQKFCDPDVFVHVTHDGFVEHFSDISRAELVEVLKSGTRASVKVDV